MTSKPETETQPPPQKGRAASKKKKKSRPFLLQRLRRQDLILLTGLLSLACFSVIVVGLLILRFRPANAGPAGAEFLGAPGPEPTHTVSFAQITGLNQYALAQAQATAWASDAQLVSANANWLSVLNKEQIGAPGEWTYRFYSPAKERLFIAKVQPDGQVHTIEHVVKITLPPPVLDTGSWVIDSPAALAIWLDYGGADLVVRNPGLEVLIQLRRINNHPNPVWIVIGTDRRTQDIHIVVIDVTNGAVVRTNLA